MIFASNHLSFSDSIFLPLVVPRKMTFLAKADYFTGTGLKGRLTKMFFTGVGQLPVDRSGGRASSAALDAGLKVLRAGDILGLYPEGTRSPDGRLYKGKTGVARMAIEAGVPVVPVAMINTDKVQPTGTVIPKIQRVGIRFGAPWTSPGMPASKRTASSCGPRPTRSCTRSWSSPGRSTSTCMPRR